MNYLISKFSELFSVNDTIIIYGEAYGGKQQGMSDTYGKELKFIGFDVKINNLWLNVPNAEEICKSLNIEFIDYVKCKTDLKNLDFERDKPSTQAIRNKCGDKIREGIVLRPLIELIKNNGERIITKYKRDEFIETKTPRKINSKRLKVLEDAKSIADEWVTEMRLKHVLDKLPKEINIEGVKDVILAMIEDVYREAKGEIIESKEVRKAISSKTVSLFKNKLKNDLKIINYY
ncbi:hypothetical protein GMMP1_510006 [Candidatus Magnetomoraceae bacterium gMMP-1]